MGSKSGRRHQYRKLMYHCWVEPDSQRGERLGRGICSTRSSLHFSRPDAFCIRKTFELLSCNLCMLPGLQHLSKSCSCHRLLLLLSFPPSPLVLATPDKTIDTEQNSPLLSSSLPICLMTVTIPLTMMKKSFEIPPWRTMSVFEGQCRSRHSRAIAIRSCAQRLALTALTLELTPTD